MKLNLLKATLYTSLIGLSSIGFSSTHITFKGSNLSSTYVGWLGAIYKWGNKPVAQQDGGVSLAPGEQSAPLTNFYGKNTAPHKSVTYDLALSVSANDSYQRAACWMFNFSNKYLDQHGLKLIQNNKDYTTNFFITNINDNYASGYMLDQNNRELDFHLPRGHLVYNAQGGYYECLAGY